MKKTRQRAKQITDCNKTIMNFQMDGNNYYRRKISNKF